MALMLALLGCAPEDVAAWEAEASRTAAALDDPGLALAPVASIWRWTPERAVGECIRYDADGTEMRRIEVTEEGLPLRIEYAGGWQVQWYRFRDDAGAVRAARGYYFDANHPDGFLLFVERLDADGRLLSRTSDAWSAEWTYDEGGRLLLSFERGGDWIRHEYAYTPEGRLMRHAQEVNGWPAETNYFWRGEKLRSWDENHRAGGGSTWFGWAIYDPGGLPTGGGGRSRDSDGNETRWTEEWTYDDSGHALTHDVNGEYDHHYAWTWESGRLVRLDHEQTAPDSEEIVAGWMEWTWDDQDRLVAISGPNGPVATWLWDEDGDFAGGSNQERAWSYEGHCPATLFPSEMPADPTPSPLPRLPALPIPYGG